MMGCLTLVVGPSGAGKDSLIRAAQAKFKDDGRFAFPRRIITRPALAAAEDHDTLTEAEFEAARAKGALSLAWVAHGLCYGVPSSIAYDLVGGKCVVVNVSRSIVFEARARFLNLAVIEVTATPDILIQRLKQRARPEDGDLSQRVSRTAPAYPPAVKPIMIDNSGALADAEAAFCSALEALVSGSP